MGLVADAARVSDRKLPALAGHSPVRERRRRGRCSCVLWAAAGQEATYQHSESAMPRGVGAESRCLGSFRSVRGRRRLPGWERGDPEQRLGLLQPFAAKADLWLLLTKLVLEDSRPELFLASGFQTASRKSCSDRFEELQHPETCIFVDLKGFFFQQKIPTLSMESLG